MIAFNTSIFILKINSYPSCSLNINCCLSKITYFSIYWFFCLCIFHFISKNAHQQLDMNFKLMKIDHMRSHILKIIGEYRLRF